MTVDESKAHRKGAWIYWRGDAADSGAVAETSWDAVTIASQHGQVATAIPAAKCPMATGVLGEA